MTAPAGTDRVTGAFIDSAPNAAGAASISASGAINVTASNTYSVQQTTGNGDLGLGAVDAAIGVATVQTNTQATVGSYAKLSSGGPITVQATDQDSQPTQITGIAGAGGVVVAQANVATLNFTSNTSAQIQNHAVILGSGATAVTVSATQEGIDQVEGEGYSGGGVAVGVVDTTANVNANVSATVGDTATIGSPQAPVSSLSVTTTTDNAVTTTAEVGTGAAGAVSDGESTGTITLAGAASIGAASVQSTGAVNVGAMSNESVNSLSNELSPGIVVGAGAAEPTAKISGSETAEIASGANISAASLGVTAASTDQTTANAQAFGTGVVTSASSYAESFVNVDTQAEIGAAVIVLSAGANVNATSDDTATGNSGKLPQSIVGNGGNFGLFSHGSTESNASIESKTQAGITGAMITASGPVTVSSTGTDGTSAYSYGLSIGAIFSALNNKATATTSPETDAWIIGSNIGSGGTVSVTADAETTATSDVVAESGGLFTAGPSYSYATDSPTVNAYLGAGSQVSAGGNITIEGMHNTGAGTGATASADAPAGGVAGEGGADPTATSDAAVNVYASPGAILDAVGSIALGATSNNDATAHANSFFGGVLGAGTSSSTATITGQALASMDGAILNAAMVTISAQSTSPGSSTGTSGEGGLVGGVGVTTKATVTPTTFAFIGNGTSPASVVSSGNVSVTSQSTDSRHDRRLRRR